MCALFGLHAIPLFYSYRIRTVCNSCIDDPILRGAPFALHIGALHWICHAPRILRRVPLPPFLRSKIAIGSKIFAASFNHFRTFDVRFSLASVGFRTNRRPHQCANNQALVFHIVHPSSLFSISATTHLCILKSNFLSVYAPLFLLL